MSTQARQHFTISRAIEYFTPGELEAQTGRPSYDFAPAVAPKELIDNAIDAAEASGRPPAVEITAHLNGATSLTVADNGNGIPPAVVQSTLDFSSRTSDKAAYRGPARGAQGNALKTLVGLPVALGADRGELEIIAQGIRHQITAWVDPSQTPRVEHRTDPAPEAPGTQFKITLPDSRADVAIGLDRLAFAYHALNPHAEVKIRVSGECSDVRNHAQSASVEISHFYRPTDPAWSKYRTRDPEAPHWHDADSFARLVQLTIHAEDLPLRAFVRRFRGLTGTAKAKAVCDALPWSRLSELDGDAQAAAVLLEAMKANTTPPAPAVLGVIGEEHLQRALAARFPLVNGRFWYRKAVGTAASPFVFEVALTETRANHNEVIYGLNFSPTFADPFSEIRFQTPDWFVSGVVSLLSANHADRQHYAAVVHLTAPGLRFLDRGKSRLAIGDREMINAIDKALNAVLKTFRDEGERAKRDARKQAREDALRLEETQEAEPTMRDAVFHVLEEAVQLAKGDEDLPTNHRTVFYKIRPLLAAHTAKELNYGYFQSTLIPEYEAKHGKFRGLYADPRGVLYHPHDGKSFAIGDRLIAGYQFPDWQYDKILFVEKKGLFPIFQAAKLMQRYDMAVVAGEGFANVAIRTLFARARKRNMQVFVVHDCDIDGYNIARTIAAETRRMPDHRIEIIDLGLTLEQSRAMELPHEEYTRRKAIPAALALTKEERAFFLAGKIGSKQWSARRVELNAMSSTQLIEMIERGLREHGADHKLIPTDEVLLETVESAYEELLNRAILREITRQLDLNAMATRVHADVTARRPTRHRPHRIARVVESAFNLDHKKATRDRPWDGPLTDHVERQFRSAGLPRLIAESVTAAIQRVQRLNKRRATR